MNKEISKEIKAIIFDVDNTLLATDKFVLVNLKQMISRLKTNGISLPEVSDEMIRKIQAKNLPFEDIFKELFFGVYAGKNLWEICLQSYRELASRLTYEATEQAVEIVDKLFKNGFVLGLVTNRVKMTPERLAQAGFDSGKFSFICQPAKEEFAKPHPRAFEQALRELSALGIGADRTVVIGDHLDDYYSSFYQNISFIAVLNGQTKREDFLKIGLENNLILDKFQNLEDSLQKLLDIKSFRRSLYNSSAIDGRYGATTAELKHYFSEYAFYKYRVKAEVEHLIALSEFFNGFVVRPLSGQEKFDLRKMADDFYIDDAYEILQYDHLGRNGIGPVEHDTKAIELWLAEKFDKTQIYDVIPNLHMFLTSEDVRNIAHKMMLRLAMDEMLKPIVYQLGDRLKDLAQQYLDCPIMSRTHFQPASPTTYGKIFATYLARLTQGLERIQSVKLQVKINGAVGNYNSFVGAYPELDWIGYSHYLAQKLNFTNFLWTDQRGPHNDVVCLFQSIQEIGNVMRDLSIDLSLYGGLGLMYFAKVDSHVGSSVMPHKVNPWLAEIAEGSLNRANFLINGLSNNLDVSRLQRDLSDHEWERAYGDIFGAVYVGLSHLLDALNLLEVDSAQAKKELADNPQIITEALQTVLRKHGIKGAYEILKESFRGKKTSLDDIAVFIEKLEVEDKIKTELKLLSDPKNYLGLAIPLTREAIDYYDDFKKRTWIKFESASDRGK
ncbi:MAG: hypothetical protein COU31_01530 [Candidatus Magasanikbacteria bacterium CG10_big_fil_rev_8_21_14_0_10_40_10]|uniref:Adenylosuccinate lyase n=1 Tax=Candidatus Magasanikbacteria bacterium CG10_big_fil_rev_8_21_14_0_10_40_10 TaxID=1974648 RepID=A0A2M6W4Q6_9BACT|nr:MAG: hypothetical protein COU31_01530 [Candidatus Magasanikbacteria bacterium CG10_big_fil_rev_8_21_14_0_10_40_10]